MEPYKLLEYVEKSWQEAIIPSLIEYIKIPNKSPHFDSNWQENGYMEQAVMHIASWCEAYAPKNMTLEVLRLENRTPLIYIEIPGDASETVLLYGHLDKQPEMSGWRDGLGPWEPVLHEDKLYGRGGADDGYAAYAALTAIKALQEQNTPHARCVIIIEASEESGSYDLPHYIKVLSERIGRPDFVVCLDSGAGNYEQLWMTTSLRGNITGKLSIELLTEGVHSGNASGIVADSFRVARILIERLEDASTGEIKLPELQCKIPPARINQAADCFEVLGDAVFQSFPLHKDVKPVSSNAQELILNRTWRAALSVTGAEGLPSIQDAGNVLRSKTSFKLSMRIPPLVTVEAAAKAMAKALTESPPYGAKVTFEMDDAASGWDAPALAPWLSAAADDASKKFFNKSAMYMGEGGTIPFMAMLGKAFPTAQFMITGVLGPNSNAHGPNEFLHLKMAEKLTASVAFVLYKHYLHVTK